MRNLAEPAPASAFPENEVTPSLAEVEDTASGLVLVIDGEVGFQSLIREHLLAAGWDYAGASSGRNGLSLARSLKPSAILLDVVLPEMDGRDVLQALKREALLREIPVVVVTARDDEHTRRTVLELGATEVVPKPFDPGSLVRRLRWIVERLETSQE